MTTTTGSHARDVDLSSATRLELGLSALEAGNVPAAVGALAAIPAAEWEAILQRFPSLPDYINKEVNK
jgi:hypothetical protein